MKFNDWLWGFCAFLVSAYLLLTLLQRTLIYSPTKQKPSRSAFTASDMQTVRLTTKDKLSLSAWYKAGKPHQPTIIIFHGNAGHIGYRMPLARAFLDQGFGVLLLEYRGYGGNPGKPYEAGLYQDAIAGMQFLIKKEKIAPQKIVLYGESLGTGVATFIAEQYPNACALILQSPYTRLASLARHHYPIIPISPWDKFDSLSRMHNIHIPLLCLHGINDKVIPITQGRRLFDAANEPKKWEEQPAAHNNLWTPEFITTVTTFIKEYCNT